MVIILKYLIFLLLCVLQPICLPLPEATTILTGTITLGSNNAFILGLVGILIGIIIVYKLTFFLNNKYLKNLVKSPSYIKYKKFMTHNPFLTTGILFAIPIIPDEIICVGSALAGISLRFILPIAIFSKIISISMITYSSQIARILKIQQWQVIVLELTIMFIAALIYSKIKQKKTFQNKISF